MARSTGITLPRHVGEATEVNYSGQPAADFGPLARDKIPVRSMAEGDLRALVAIDRRIIGRDRAAYFQRKLAEALTESDVRVSLVAELDTVPVGFIMARVDLGEFGRVETTAVIDTIGVDPDYRNRASAALWCRNCWRTSARCASRRCALKSTGKTTICSRISIAAVSFHRNSCVSTGPSFEIAVDAREIEICLPAAL
jgi:hypothetical protein